MRAALLAPILPPVMKEGESKQAALILMKNSHFDRTLRYMQNKLLFDSPEFGAIWKEILQECFYRAVFCLEAVIKGREKGRCLSWASMLLDCFPPSLDCYECQFKGHSRHASKIKTIVGIVMRDARFGAGYCCSNHTGKFASHLTRRSMLLSLHYIEEVK